MASPYVVRNEVPATKTYGQPFGFLALLRQGDHADPTPIR